MTKNEALLSFAVSIIYLLLTIQFHLVSVMLFALFFMSMMWQFFPVMIIVSLKGIKFKFGWNNILVDK